jgi:hypothetical protein
MDAIGYSTPALVLILAADFAITSLHSYQEWRGAGAPLWRNFGAIVGLDIPNWFGFLLFTAFLTLVLFALGFVGIIGPLGDSGWTAGALGVLIGARLSDTIVSHVLLYTVGYRPNPGLSSTPLYVVEAFFLGYSFKTLLTAHPDCTVTGFAIGALFFVGVLPSLRLMRWLSPACRRTPWSSWEPIPPWASTNY